MKININILCIFEVARLLEKVASIRQKEARISAKVGDSFENRPIFRETSYILQVNCLQDEF